VEIRKIKASETLLLRRNILRPGLTLEQCNFFGDEDDSTIHLGCFLDATLVGVVSIYKRSNSDVHTGCGFQIRAMATCDSVRGKGIGLKLLNSAETCAFDLVGAHYLWANARTSAIGFYKKAGYTVCGEEFDIEGVGPHFLIFLANASQVTLKDK